MGCGSSHAEDSDGTITCAKDLVYLERQANVKYSFGFTAEAKGAGDALILLCGPSEEPRFRISLGADANQSVRISCQSDSALLAEVQYARILDPDAFRGFWVTWRNSSLSVGSGYRPGQQELLSFPMQGAEANFRPYFIKAACEAPKGKVSWRSIKLLLDE